MGVVDDRFHAQAVGKFEGRNIARIRQGAPQRDQALVTFVVVVRRIGPGSGLERDGRIQNSVIGRCTLIDRGGVDERLERRSHLAQSLGSTVELRLVEIPPTDHGFDLAAGVVDGDQRGLGAGILFQADTRFTAGIKREDFHVRQIAGP